MTPEHEWQMLQQGNPLWYLASPYTNYRPSEDAPICHATAAVRAARYANELAEHGITAISPVIQGHHMAGGLDPELRTDSDWWVRYWEPLIHQCHGIIVCKMWGWWESSGIMKEIQMFAAQSKSIKFYTLGEPPR